MTALAKTPMTVDEYLTWAGEQPGRYELLDGVVFAMSPEGAGHAERKAAVHAALLARIRSRRLACHALPDGMTIRIDDATAYEGPATQVSPVS
jgi:Uma2 family endonuclease